MDNYNDKKYVDVPNVVGLDKNDAIKILKEFKVEYTGNGNIITYQSPSAGERILEGETIRLLLEE